MALPELVTQNDLETTRPAASFLISPYKAPTENWLDLEHVKKLSANFLSADTSSSLVVDKREQAIAIDRHARKAPVLIPEIEKIWVAKGGEFWCQPSFGEVNSTEGHKLLRRG